MVIITGTHMRAIFRYVNNVNKNKDAQMPKYDTTVHISPHQYSIHEKSKRFNSNYWRTYSSYRGHYSLNRTVIYNWCTVEKTEGRQYKHE